MMTYPNRLLFIKALQQMLEKYYQQAKDDETKQANVTLIIGNIISGFSGNKDWKKITNKILPVEINKQGLGWVYVNVRDHYKIIDKELLDVWIASIILYLKENE